MLRNGAYSLLSVGLCVVSVLSSAPYTAQASEQLQKLTALNFYMERYFKRWNDKSEGRMKRCYNMLNGTLANGFSAPREVLYGDVEKVFEILLDADEASIESVMEFSPETVELTIEKVLGITYKDLLRKYENDENRDLFNILLGKSVVEKYKLLLIYVLSKEQLKPFIENISAFSIEKAIIDAMNKAEKTNGKLESIQEIIQKIPKVERQIPIEATSNSLLLLLTNANETEGNLIPFLNELEKQCIMPEGTYFNRNNAKEIISTWYTEFQNMEHPTLGFKLQLPEKLQQFLLQGKLEKGTQEMEELKQELLPLYSTSSELKKFFSPTNRYKRMSMKSSTKKDPKFLTSSRFKDLVILINKLKDLNVEEYIKKVQASDNRNSVTSISDSNQSILKEKYIRKIVASMPVFMKAGPTDKEHFSLIKHGQARKFIYDGTAPEKYTTTAELMGKYKDLLIDSEFPGFDYVRDVDVSTYLKQTFTNCPLSEYATSYDKKYAVKNFSKETFDNLVGNFINQARIVENTAPRFVLPAEWKAHVQSHYPLMANCLIQAAFAKNPNDLKVDQICASDESKLLAVLIVKETIKRDISDEVFFVRHDLPQLNIKQFTANAYSEHGQLFRNVLALPPTTSKL